VCLVGARAVTLPGYGTLQDANGSVAAQLCPRGYYSAGGHQLACSSCPANMTTLQIGAAALSHCGKLQAPQLSFSACATSAYSSTAHWAVVAACTSPSKASEHRKHHDRSKGCSALTCTLLCCLHATAVSLPGFYYSSGTAVPCAKGSYQDTAGYAAACDACEAGVTTPEPASAHSTHCSGK
jgi:hypothetical protein